MSVDVVGVRRAEVDGRTVALGVKNTRPVPGSVSCLTDFPTARPGSFNAPTGWSSHGLLKGVSIRHAFVSTKRR